MDSYTRVSPRQEENSTLHLVLKPISWIFMLHSVPDQYQFVILECYAKAGNRRSGPSLLMAVQGLSQSEKTLHVQRLLAMEKAPHKVKIFYVAAL